MGGGEVGGSRWEAGGVRRAKESGEYLCVCVSAGMCVCVCVCLCLCLCLCVCSREAGGSNAPPPDPSPAIESVGARRRVVVGEETRVYACVCFCSDGWACVQAR